MRRVHSEDTGPERLVRSLVTRLGYRYRLHRRDLPGTPDLAFISRKKLIFVNGCFWHGHDCEHGKRMPQTHTEYWAAKIVRNVERDGAVICKLQKAGWGVLVVWECELKDVDRVSARLQRFLGEQKLRQNNRLDQTP